MAKQNQYNHIVVFESEGDCPHNKIIMGDTLPQSRSVFYWISEDNIVKDEVAETSLIDVVCLPNKMTTTEVREWIQSNPNQLNGVFTEEEINQINQLDKLFGKTKWNQAKQQ